MPFSDWSFIVGAALSVALTAGPWMFKVHAKLAVIASKVIDLCEKLERTTDDHRRLWEVCSRHESRLDTHDVQLSHKRTHGRLHDDDDHHGGTDHHHARSQDDDHLRLQHDDDHGARDRLLELHLVPSPGLRLGQHVERLPRAMQLRRSQRCPGRLFNRDDALHANRGSVPAAPAALWRQLLLHLRPRLGLVLRGRQLLGRHAGLLLWPPHERLRRVRRAGDYGLPGAAGHPKRGDLLPTAEMFYVYRWGTGSRHLSGVSDGSPRPHQAHWDALGKLPIEQGTFRIEPRLRGDVLVEYDHAGRLAAQNNVGAF